MVIRQLTAVSCCVQAIAVAMICASVLMGGSPALVQFLLCTPWDRLQRLSQGCEPPPSFIHTRSNDRRAARALQARPFVYAIVMLSIHFCKVLSLDLSHYLLLAVARHTHRLRHSCECVRGRSLGEVTEDMTEAEPSEAPRSLVNGRLDPRLLAMVVDFVCHIHEQAPYLFPLPSDKGTAVRMPILIWRVPRHWLGLLLCKGALARTVLQTVQWSIAVLPNDVSGASRRAALASR